MLNGNRTKNTEQTVFYALVTSVLLIATILLTSSSHYEVEAQNATNATGTNQTTGETASQFGNLTAADFEAILSDLGSARESVHDNDTKQAYDSLNFVDNGIFRVGVDVGPQNMASFQQQLTPVRDAIQNVRLALIQNDLAKALEELSNVDVAVLKVVRVLPPGEESE